MKNILILRSIEVYTRNGDDLTIGKARLEKIEYKFWQGKFGYADIIVKGFKNFAKLKKAMIDKYGEGAHAQPIGSGPKFLWEWWGKRTYILLVYKEELGEGWLFMGTSEIEKQMHEYYKTQRNE